MVVFIQMNDVFGGSSPDGVGMVEKQNSGIPTVKFDATNVTEAVKAALRDNIKSLGEISSGHFDMIYNAAVRSITAGRDLRILYLALVTIDGMSRRRAEDISRSLNNKATALMDAERQERLGIKYAVWLYSGAPCGPGHDAAHKAANGKRYAVDKGMLLHGQWTRPGREDGCKCVAKPVIPGFD
jgi:uncharacterized protein with gpF-like domain